ncbi:chemokine XC receptor 1 [Engraulis encrasicolus]|uniref:chemokine XC receptor 1 n=1 Tax=Engraulis encrasicolus TaxID=184585 RepID=UPI002FD76DB7
MCEKDDVRKFGAVVTTVFFSLVVVFSVIGNVLVLVILIKYENLKSMTNAFLFNLAVSDLIFTVGLPFWAYYDIYTWTFGAFGTEVCKVVSFIFDVGFYSSAIFLTTMTIHRYMAVVHPMTTMGSRRTLYCLLTSLTIWLASCLLAVPAAILKTAQSNQNDNSLHCEYNHLEWKIVGAYMQNGFFLVSFAIISFCYIQILLRLLRPTSHTRHKTVRLIFIIVVVFFLGWAPYNVAVFLRERCDRMLPPFDNCDVCKTVDYAHYVTRLVAFSHCCLNPVFYVFMGIKFRNHLKNLLRYCGGMTDVQRRHSRLIYSNASTLSRVTSFNEQL